jgi:hypothetical protein
MAGEGSVTFAPGELTQRILVPIAGDDLAENDETFIVSIGAALNANVSRGTATGTIVDDDQPATTTRRRSVRH